MTRSRESTRARFMAGRLYQFDECDDRVAVATIGRVDKTFLLIGALAGFLAVALGAFGAHALRSRLSPEMLAVFETGVRYHMYHALAIVLVALIMGRMDGWLIQMSGWAFTIGLLLFPGSLYLLAFTGVTIFGAITPLGGLAFLIGWASLAIAAI